MTVDFFEEPLEESPPPRQQRRRERREQREEQREWCRQRQERRREKRRQRGLHPAWVVGPLLLGFLAVVAAIFFMVPRHQKAGPVATTRKPAVAATVPRTAQQKRRPAPAPAPKPEPRECTTPCTLYVGWDEQILAEGRPVMILFHGKEEWVLLPSQGKRFSPDEFAPGDAQFASPEDDPTPVRVEIIPVAK